jgi:TolB protein
VTRAVRLLALGAVVLLAGCGGGSDAVEPDLVLVSTRDGDYALFGLNLVDGEEQRLTEEKGDPATPDGLFFQIDPAWSPDGATIAFASKRSGTFDLYTMDADGSGTERLTSTREDDGQPDWSPDGEQIVFVRGTPTHLFLMDADGTGARRLTDDTAPETDPAWSPDGEWIAYSRRESGTIIRELWLVRPDGSDRHALTTLDAIAASPTWSPDSKRLAFSANVEGKGLDVYTVGADGKDTQPFTSGEDSFEPAWSPDGATIAFSEAGAIISIDVESGEERTLTDAENNDSSPTWKPGPDGEEG